MELNNSNSDLSKEWNVLVSGKGTLDGKYSTPDNLLFSNKNMDATALVRIMSIPCSSCLTKPPSIPATLKFKRGSILDFIKTEFSRIKKLEVIK